jgi:hypothetical protein
VIQPLVAFVATRAVAGPWIHDPGAWYVKLYGARFEGGSAVELETTSVGMYSEVGIVRGLQLQAEMPYISARSRMEGSSLTWGRDAFGPARVGFGVRPPGLHVPVSLHVLGRFPTSSSVSAAPLQPQLGEPQVDLEVIGAGGGSAPIGSQWTWALAEAGWRHRTDWAPWPDTEPVDGDDLLYRAQLGLLPVVESRALGWVELHAAGAFGNAERSTHQWGGSVAVAVAHGLHVELGGDHTYAGGTVHGVSLNAGLSHVRKRPAE